LSFEDKILLKTCGNVKDFLLEDCQGNFLTRTGNSSLGLVLVVDGVEY